MKTIKLHLGGGERYIPGFVHVDKRKFKHIDFVQDVRDLSSFEDNSVDLIYSCHILEHFKRKEISAVLSEWYRVLKQRGILRISVPGLEEIIKVYERYNDIKLVLGPLVGGQTYLYNFHYIVFDFKFLREKLTGVGFKFVQRYDWKKTEHSHIDDYSQAYVPHMDKENGLPISLNVEAVK